jgi:hypothetical protein
MEEVGAASAGETMVEGRRRETFDHRRYSVAASARERRGRVQRERVARVRVRGRRGLPS